MPHTPGPWRVDGVEVFGPDNTHIVWELSCTKADADLIAAAPDLLTALKLMLSTHDVSCQGEACGIAGIDLARAAVAKAEGG